MDAKEFIDGLYRMLNSKGRISGLCNGIDCLNCDFYMPNNKCALRDWGNCESMYKAIDTVKKWSEENKQRGVPQSIPKRKDG